MKKIDILTIESPNRAPLKVEGYLFGEENNGPSVAIVGALSGDHINQLFAASQFVDYLKVKEQEGMIKGKILVIPAVNTYALNMGETFWPLDKIDINMMFPGYDKGEATQRIAGKLFSALQGFDYGIILEGRRDQGMCLPYIKLIKSGYEDLEVAKSFGMRFIHYRTLSPIETVMLQYNWQLWGTKAVSLVFGKNGSISSNDTKNVHQSITRFMAHYKILENNLFTGFESNIIDSKNIIVLKADRAGIFDSKVECGTYVTKGEVLGKIYDSMNGEKLQTITASYEGVVTCQYSYPLIFQNSIAFRMAVTN